MAVIQITQRVCDYCTGKHPAKARHTCSICGADLCNCHVGVEFTEERSNVSLDSGSLSVSALCPGVLCPSCTKAWKKVPMDIKSSLFKEHLERLRPVIVAIKL